MKVNILEQKSKLQKEMSDYLIKEGNLIIRWPTGMGKTKIAIDAFYKQYSKKENSKFLLVIAESAHKSNWKEEFIKFLGENTTEKIFSCITVICYASLKKYKNTFWDIICFDEAHHLQSDTRKEILLSISSYRILALSATLKDDVIEFLKECFGQFKTSKYSLQDAINRGFLPEPKIVCIPLELKRFDKTETIEMDLRTVKSGDKGIIYDLWSNRWKYLKNRKAYLGHVLRFSCTQKEKYEYINEQFDYWKGQYFRNQGNIRLKNMWLQWGTKRKRFLGELKTREAEELCIKLNKEGKRFICFCSSITQAEFLGGENCIHSKKSGVKEVISAFNSGKTNSIFAVGMLQEGQNLTNIQAGIIVQLDGEERGFIQKFGRSLRASDPVQYIFYYRGTRDEEYLQKALEGIDEKYIMEE